MNNTIYLIITNRCNLKCEDCFYTQEPWRIVDDRLNLKDLYSVIQQAHYLGFKEVSFTGGEPLLSKYIFKLIRFAKTLGMKTTISTNASLLKIKTIKKLKTSGLENLYISLSSDYFFNTNNWKNKASTIVVEAKREKFKSMALVFVVTRKNLKLLEEIINFTVKEKVSLQIQPAYISLKNNNLSLWNLNESERKQFKKLLNRLRKKRNINEKYIHLILSYYSKKKIKKLPHYCHFAKEDLVVDADGRIYPCFHRRDLCLGSILDNSLEDCIKRLKNGEKQAMVMAECVGEHCLSLFTG